MHEEYGGVVGVAKSNAKYNELFVLFRFFFFFFTHLMRRILGRESYLLGDFLQAYPLWDKPQRKVMQRECSNAIHA